MVELRSNEEIMDFARGCTFMGTGGGGEPSEGIACIRRVQDDRKVVSWVNPEEIPDDMWTASSYGMGSIAPLTEGIKKEIQRFGLKHEGFKSAQAEAIRLLEKYRGVKIGAIVPIELGGGNTLEALAAAAELGIQAVDGDYTGRSVPEDPQTTPYLAGLAHWPIASVDQYGNEIIIKDSTGYLMVERIGKFLSVASFGEISQAGFLFRGCDMKRVVIPGTLSKCLEIGRAIREFREAGEDPVAEAIKMLGGWLLFEGEVTRKEWEDRDGYYFGTHTITGLDEFEGCQLKIWFENENHISWLNGSPYVVSPDMLIIVDRESGEPSTNASLDEGQHVAVIGLPAVEQFRSPKGIDILGPRHFGFDIDYRAIKDIMKS